MATFAEIRRRVALDVICVLSVGLVLLLIELFARPYNRGFFCGDPTIQYPYIESTISTGLLASIALPLPVIVVILCEGINLFESCTPRDSWRSVTMRLGANCYYFAGMFIFGAGLSQMTVDIAKYTVGRLRPHFLSVCKPSIDCSTKSPFEYVTNYSCSGDFDMSTEARLSFPSGHSALSFYAAFYIMMYLQKRMLWRGSQTLRHLIQGIFLFAAWFTALSRIQNNMHHWDDVLAGIVIGSFWTTFVVKFIVDLKLPFVTDEELWTLRKPRDSQNQGSV